MTRRVVEIVPLDVSNRDILVALSHQVARVYSLRCRVGADGHLPAAALDAARGQYYSTQILRSLDNSERDSFRLLGVTDADIFTPIMRYVFGEAMLLGRAALVSTYRLAVLPSRGDCPEDRSILLSRVIKEGIHELGHTFNLTHCKDPTCVMSASLDTKRIDAKSAQLCYYCRILLKDELNP